MLVALGAVPAVSGVHGHADGCLPCPDGGLYTATRYEFRSLPDIRRNLHQRPLKTEESPLHWLNGEPSLSARTGVTGCGTLCIATTPMVGPQSLPLTPHPPDAEFVASVLVRESKDSPVGDDDKIYYFFTERAGEETTSFFDKSQVARVARVARVCKVGMSLATGSQALLLPVETLGETEARAEGDTRPQQPVQKCSLHSPRATWGGRRSCSANGRPS